MNPADLKYPVISLVDADPPRAEWDLFWDFDEISHCDRSHLPMRVGMLIVDVEGHCWQVSSVRDLGVKGARRSPLMMLWLQERRVEQTLVPLPDVTFADVQRRLCAAIQSNWDLWRDDEEIAGEGGRPMRDEQELRNEMKAEVMRSESVLDLIRNFWKEDPEYCLAKVAQRQAKRRRRSTSH